MFFEKPNALVRVGLAPLAHRHAEAAFEEGLEVELVSGSAHRADAGDVILGVIDALLDEIVDFFPRPKKPILRGKQLEKGVGETHRNMAM